MKTKYHIEIGFKVGKLTIVKIVKRKGLSDQIHAVCECGNKCIRARNSITATLRTNGTPACGCTRGKSRKFEHGEHFSSHYVNYKKSKARKKNIEWNLTIFDLDELYNKQDGRCYYTGRKLKLPDWKKNFWNGKNIAQDFNVSIDKLDSNKPYTISNCVLCIAQANFAKHILTESEFIQLCRDVVNHCG